MTRDGPTLRLEISPIKFKKKKRKKTKVLIKIYLIS